jgi:hypothetical protein
MNIPRNFIETLAQPLQFLFTIPGKPDHNTQILAAFENLAGKLRSLRGIPLSVENIQGVSQGKKKKKMNQKNKNKNCLKKFSDTRHRYPTNPIKIKFYPLRPL